MLGLKLTHASNRSLRKPGKYGIYLISVFNLQALLRRTTEVIYISVCLRVCILVCLSVNLFVSLSAISQDGFSLIELEGIWGRLSIKMSSYQYLYRHPHVKDKTVSPPSYWRVCQHHYVIYLSKWMDFHDILKTRQIWHDLFWWISNEANVFTASDVWPDAPTWSLYELHANSGGHRDCWWVPCINTGGRSEGREIHPVHRWQPQLHGGCTWWKAGVSQAHGSHVCHSCIGVREVISGRAWHARNPTTAVEPAWYSCLSRWLHEYPDGLCGTIKWYHRRVSATAAIREGCPVESGRQPTNQDNCRPTRGPASEWAILRRWCGDSDVLRKTSAQDSWPGWYTSDRRAPVPYWRTN